MGLDDAVFVQSSPVADLDEIELEKAGGLYVSSASDPRAEQPEVPGEQGRSQQGFERERGEKELVQRVDELQSPNERAPERAFEGPEASHDRPFRERHCAGHC